jgi:hypothetical protein
MPEPKSATATWVRVKLAAPPDPAAPRVNMTEGELVLRADRVAVDEDSLLFLVGEEVQFRLDRAYFRALTWFVDRPTFGEWLKARRAQFPKSHHAWTSEDRAVLAREVAAGADWLEIATMLGRTASAVRRQAARAEASRNEQSTFELNQGEAHAQ